MYCIAPPPPNSVIFGTFGIGMRGGEGCVVSRFFTQVTNLDIEAKGIGVVFCFGLTALSNLLNRREKHYLSLWFLAHLSKRIFGGVFWPAKGIGRHIYNVTFIVFIYIIFQGSLDCQYHHQ